MTINTSIGQIQFYIVEANTPFLLNLANINTLKVYFNNFKNVLITPNSPILVVYQFGHSFLLWKSPLHMYLIEFFNCNPCYLTNIKLQYFYQHFGHPSVKRLKKVLNRLSHKVKKKFLKYLTRYYTYC